MVTTLNPSLNDASANLNNSAVQTPVRVRFAPSPTGNLHIGGARTAIYNWAFARHNNGSFILRIEDTDPERSTPENTAQIIRSLQWLGLSWDEGPNVGGDGGPYLQSQRFDTYRTELQKMIAEGTVYPCFCSPANLDARRAEAQAEKRNYGYNRACRSIPLEQAKARVAAGEPHTWRLKIPLELQAVSFDDQVYGEISVPIEQLDDFILVRSDGTPTYNFVVSVDDALMGITHVIRGDDHISNTPKQILVYQALGYPTPQFAHLSMILGGDGKRLSKRHGATSVEVYRDAGYLPQALLNYLSLLGWSLDGESTVISTEELIVHFSLQRISKNPAIFDNQKLDWINQAYIKQMGASAFLNAALPWLIDCKLTTAEQVAANPAWYQAIYPLIAERVHRLAEVPAMIAYLFSGASVLLDERSVEKCLHTEGSGKVLEQALALLKDETLAWNHETIEAALRTIPESLGVKPKLVFQPIRVAICGNMVSPPLFESLVLVGRGNSLKRLKSALLLAK